MTSSTTLSSSSPSSSSPSSPSLPRWWCSMIVLFLSYSCCKILLIPSYRSTDFDVHRNWLAITRHLPLLEWYFDDVNGTTVHTLDYPPSFAYFEYLLANNPITTKLFLLLLSDENERCLQLLPDSDNTPSPACVVFHRSTVILMDVIFWWGAWVMTTSAAASSSSQRHYYYYYYPTSFLLIVFHPGFLWLDHVHFQYNGMLFGIFLASLGYLMQANNDNNNNSNNPLTFHTSHCKAAILFALLLTMKHLFLTLAPFYFVYLLRRYCLQPPPSSPPSSNSSLSSTKTTTTQDHQSKLQLYPRHLLLLATCTATTLLVPFLPFLSQQQLTQILKRLFPFGRGLVHDYWAANVWALYSLLDKLIGQGIAGMSLPTVSAGVCAILLLVALLPGLYCAWQAAARHDNRQLILAVVYSALSSFMLGFHVHEKAILNAIVPFLVLVVCDGGTNTNANTTTTTTTTTTTATTTSTNNNNTGTSRATTTLKFLFLQMTALGLLGIFPLLFRPAELALKLTTYIAYMAVCYHHTVLIMVQEQPSQSKQQPSKQQQRMELLPYLALVVGIIILLEFIPMKFYGKLEFLPLLCTSVGCALGLVLCWIRLLLLCIINIA